MYNLGVESSECNVVKNINKFKTRKEKKKQFGSHERYYQIYLKTFVIQ